VNDTLPDERLAGFRDLAAEQVGRAEGALTLAPRRRLRFKPHALHGITRYLVPGQFILVTAATGIGKTTFLLSTADDFLLLGKKVAMLGLEQEDHELRTALACLRAGVPRHIAIENSWLEYADGREMFERVRHQLDAQACSPLLDQLLLLPHRYIDTKTLITAAKEAHDFGAEVLIVDHIHHIQAGADYSEFARLVQASKKIAEDFGFVNLSAAQINRESLRASGSHRLTRYMPAQLHQIQGGGVIEQNVNMALNLYRPVMVPKNDEETKKLKAAMRGEIEPGEVLQRNRMGVAVLKHRSNGSLEGRRCILALEDGKVVDVPLEEQLGQPT
jgi:KaiC/GvpD/RAD55 family RecA-like ATPase